MEFIGSSEAAFNIRKIIMAISKSPFNILISGETGTGKSKVAGIIHCESNRKEKPFIVVNCSEISEKSFIPLFFGNKKNAGYLELAAGGDIYLDEINCLPIKAQKSLSIIARKRNFSKPHSHKSININCRFISSCSNPCSCLTEESSFDRKLYYSLSELQIYLTPLRERRSDIKAFIRYFLYKKLKYNHIVITNDAIRELTEHLWPGNLNELHNYILNLILRRKNDRITSSDLIPFEKVSKKNEFHDCEDGFSLTRATDIFESDLINNRLKQHGGNKSKTARILGISRASLYRKIK